MKVLIVEDEKKVLTFIKKGLMSAEIAADTASNLEEMFSLLMTGNYDAIVLDRLLGGTDSMNYLADIKKKAASSKILFLSALSDIEDKVTGLTSGADDYLAKPFHITELIARLRAICRREQNRDTRDNLITLKDLNIYLDSQKVERGQTRINLTAKEYKLLVMLVKRPNKVFSKSEILNNVWEIQYFPESNVVEVLVNHLRVKVDKDFEVPLIHSKRGVGYWAGDKEL